MYEKLRLLPSTTVRVFGRVEPEVSSNVFPGKIGEMRRIVEPSRHRRQAMAVGEDEADLELLELLDGGDEIDHRSLSFLVTPDLVLPDPVEQRASGAEIEGHVVGDLPSGTTRNLPPPPPGLDRLIVDRAVDQPVGRSVCRGMEPSPPDDQLQVVDVEDAEREGGALGRSHRLLPKCRCQSSAAVSVAPETLGSLQR